MTMLPSTAKLAPILVVPTTFMRRRPLTSASTALAAGHLGGDLAEFLARHGVEEAGIGFVQQAGGFHDSGGPDGRGIGNDAVDEERLFVPRPRVAPLGHAHVERRDFLDFGMPLGAGQEPARERLGAGDLVSVRVEDDQVAAQLAMNGGRARQGRAQESELHPHEKIGEDDPDDGGHQLGASVLELKPGDGKASERASHWLCPPTSMTTSALALESPATLRLSSALKLDAHLDDAGVDVGDRVVAEDDLAADDQVFANDFAGQVGRRAWECGPWPSGRSRPCPRPARRPRRPRA